MYVKPVSDYKLQQELVLWASLKMSLEGQKKIKLIS